MAQHGLRRLRVARTEKTSSNDHPVKVAVANLFVGRDGEVQHAQAFAEWLVLWDDVPVLKAPLYQHPKAQHTKLLQCQALLVLPTLASSRGQAGSAQEHVPWATTQERHDQLALPALLEFVVLECTHFRCCALVFVVRRF